MKKYIGAVLAIAFILALCGCTTEITNDTDKLSIVAVSFPEYDFARAVAGNEAEITMLIPPAGEAHGYEPTVSDIKKVSECDLFIYTGGESDTWVEDILSSVGNRNIQTLALTDCVDTICTEEHNHSDENSQNHEHNKYTTDEHVWTSPKNAISIVNSVRDSLIKVDAENENTFAENAKAYCERLENLDKSIREITEKTNKNTLVFGDRFPLTYFAESYNLEYLAAFSGCSDDTEASAQTVASLIDFVKENELPVVFINELSNTSIAEQIAKETGAEVMTFYSCHKISKDDFESGKTYVDIMSRNIDALNIALK